jgi:molecular chaperone DnaK
VPQIEVAFDIDANGIVNVTAKDVATGREQKITITSSSGLSKDEVTRMVKDAEAHAAEDQDRRSVIDARNQADSLAYATEKTVNDHRDRLPAADVARVEAAIADAREAAKGDDLDAIRRATEALQTSAHGLSEQVYRQSQNDQQSQAGQPGGTDHVKDAEVVDA